MSGHKTKAVKMETGLGIMSYRAECSCGWKGGYRYARGSRDSARWDAADHEAEVWEASSQVSR